MWIMGGGSKRWPRWDLVVTHDHGPPRGIRRTVTRGQGDHAPIRFAPGAIGDDRDPRASPQPRFLVTDWRTELLFGEVEVLVPAKFPFGCPVARIAPYASVSHIHLMFDTHQILLAEGVCSKSVFPGVWFWPATPIPARRSSGCSPPNPSAPRAMAKPRTAC